MMTSITLELSFTGEQVPVNDVNLDSVTNTELFTKAVIAGIVPSLRTDNSYKMVSNKTNQPIIETATLSSLGFADGDTIKISQKPEYWS
jgi:hypothetical protein